MDVKDVVLIYDAEPRPTTVDVKDVVLIYPAVPRPLTVEANRGPLPTKVETSDAVEI